MTPEEKVAAELLRLQRKLLGLQDEAKCLVLEAAEIYGKNEVGVEAMRLFLGINIAVKALPESVREDFKNGG